MEVSDPWVDSRSILFIGQEVSPGGLQKPFAHFSVWQFLVRSRYLKDWCLYIQTLITVPELSVHFDNIYWEVDDFWVP